MVQKVKVSVNSISVPPQCACRARGAPAFAGWVLGRNCVMNSWIWASINLSVVALEENPQNCPELFTNLAQIPSWHRRRSLQQQCPVLKVEEAARRENTRLGIRGHHILKQNSRGSVWTCQFSRVGVGEGRKEVKLTRSRAAFWERAMCSTRRRIRGKSRALGRSVANSSQGGRALLGWVKCPGHPAVPPPLLPRGWGWIPTGLLQHDEIPPLTLGRGRKAGHRQVARKAQWQGVPAIKFRRKWYLIGGY